MKGQKCVQHTHPRAPHILRLGAAYANCCLKHGVWGGVAGSGNGIAPLSSHHSITNWQEETCSQKIIKISRPSQTIWPDLITSPKSIQVIKWCCQSCAPGYTKSKCRVKTSGDLSHVTDSPPRDVH